jgi:hypothetical protein
VIAATLVGAVSLTGCGSDTDDAGSAGRAASETPFHGAAAVPTTSAGPHGEPPAPATTAAPSYPIALAPSETPAGTLPLLHSVATNAVSIPWDVISRDKSTGIVIVDADDGGCVSPPFGYTATTYRHSTLIIAVYSTDLLPSGEACAGVGHIVTYRFILPSGDAELSLAHAPY